MKNYVVLTREYPPDIGGVGVYARQILSALEHGMGYDVKLIYEKISRREAGAIYKTLKLFLRAFFLKRVDKYIALTWQIEGVLCLGIYFIVRRRYSIIVHGREVVKEKGHVSKIFLMMVAHFADEVICNSNYTKGRFIKYVGLGRVIVINPCVDNDIDNFVIEKRKKQVLLMTARIVERKGHRIAIDVVSELRRQGLEYEFWFTGSGNGANLLVSYARQIGCESWVRPLGWLSRSELLEAYSQARFYISPGKECGDEVEGFGISLIEAACLGVYVIVSDSGGVRDAIINNKLGVVYECATPRQIADIIRELSPNLDPITVSREAMAHHHRGRMEACMKAEGI